MSYEEQKKITKKLVVEMGDESEYESEAEEPLQSIVRGSSSSQDKKPQQAQ